VEIKKIEINKILNKDIIAETGTATATITRNTDINSECIVTLNSSDTTEAKVPQTVTIPVGQTSATVSITGVDDGINDGSQPVTITASANGLNSGTDSLVVTDISVPDLGVTQLQGVQPTYTSKQSQFTYTVTNNGIITIGAAYTNATENFQGSIDEVRVWNVARTASEILSNMKVELNAQAGLVAAYHFNEGIAAGTNTGLTTTADASGNNLNGTLNNFARTGNTSNWVAGQSFDAKISGNAPATFPVGNTIVTWTATDGFGNTATCNQTVNVVTPTGTQVLASNNVLITDGDATPSFSDFTDFRIRFIIIISIFLIKLD
jgi:hypothetical protein